MVNRRRISHESCVKRLVKQAHDQCDTTMTVGTFASRHQLPIVSILSSHVAYMQVSSERPDEIKCVPGHAAG